MKFVPPATVSFEQRPAIVVSNCLQNRKVPFQRLSFKLNWCTEDMLKFLVRIRFQENYYGEFAV